MSEMNKPYLYGVQGHAASWFENAAHALEMAKSLEDMLDDPLLLNRDQVHAEMERLLVIAIDWDIIERR